MKFSIRKKTIAMIIAFALVLILVSMFIYSRVIWNVTEELYKTEADNAAAAVAANVDPARFEVLKNEVYRIYSQTAENVREADGESKQFKEYVANFNELRGSEEYKGLLSYLKKMEKALGVESAYLAFVDGANDNFVYVLDAAPEDACPPGKVDELYDENSGVKTDPELGFPAYITDTDQYRWLVTSGVALKDASGQVVGYAMVDLSMETVRSEHISYIFRLLMPLLLSLLLICVLGIIIVNRLLINPIKQLSSTASDYRKKESGGHYDGFSRLDIRTGDEIESLAESMKQMEYDLNDRINEILAAKGEALRSQHIAAEMTEIANKDSLTGVKNKTAYDSEAAALDEAIRKGEARFAIVMVDMNGLKETNDTYGHERGDEKIRAVCSVICKVFDHSPVFRIGGDEFVVVTKNSQYDEIESLIDVFNERIDKLATDKTLEPWQRISAAVGYARFEPERDDNSAAVFRRADEAMYERKREMKGTQEQK